MALDRLTKTVKKVALCVFRRDKRIQDVLDATNSTLCHKFQPPGLLARLKTYIKAMDGFYTDEEVQPLISFHVQGFEPIPGAEFGWDSDTERQQDAFPLLGETIDTESDTNRDTGYDIEYDAESARFSYTQTPPHMIRPTEPSGLFSLSEHSHDSGFNLLQAPPPTRLPSPNDSNEVPSTAATQSSPDDNSSDSSSDASSYHSSAPPPDEEEQDPLAIARARILVLERALAAESAAAAAARRSIACRDGLMRILTTQRDTAEAEASRLRGRLSAWYDYQVQRAAEREQQQELAGRMDRAQQRLAYHVEILRHDEGRLAAWRSGLADTQRRLAGREQALRDRELEARVREMRVSVRETRVAWEEARRA